MKPLISILIATKNRQKYCLSAVQSILRLPNANIQVVVQDNSDDTTLNEMLKSLLGDSRLVYRYTPPPFSSIDNFNAAIELATGEYICLIGDDDGINPEIISAAGWAKENNIECIVGNLKANYRWEKTGEKKFLHIKVVSNSLIIGDFNGVAKKVDPKQSLLKLIQNGCTNYMEFDFPKLYHGVVKRAIFEQLKQETGAYLKGLSPDIYAAIALSFKINQFIVIDYPLTIPGVCSVSSSVQEGEQKSNSKDLENAPHLRDRSIPYLWEINVPRIYCVQTIWADSAFAAIKEFKHEDLLKNFDVYKLCSNILDADPTLQSRVLSFLEQKYPTLTSRELLNRIEMVGSRNNLKVKIFKLILNIKRLLGIERYMSITNITSIVDATKKLQEILIKFQINLVNELDKTKR
ncbi:glycosyltransferase family 2 protein [Acinetobacter sp.]|uniref:glycosyltransferase family 2 protein n=1 Tax=Acinetobacter sp. TaxID=472 RepID=UPI002FC59654